MSDDPEKTIPVLDIFPRGIGKSSPAYVDFDEVRRNAKDMNEATVPLTPDLEQFLDRWRMARMNNKRVVGPVNRLTQNMGLDPRNPPGSTKRG